jgi:hypothetical protein
MDQSTATTRLLSMQGKSVDAAPVLRRTASKGGKSPTRIKISLTGTVTAACANAKKRFITDYWETPNADLIEYISVSLITATEAPFL